MIKCACGKEYKTKGWLARHQCKCIAHQSTPLGAIAFITRRAFTSKLIDQLLEKNQLLKRMEANNGMQ